MKLTIFQCDLCKAEHRGESVAHLVLKTEFPESMTVYPPEIYYHDICETCEAEIKKTIERIKK